MKKLLMALVGIFLLAGCAQTTKVPTQIVDNSAVKNLVTKSPDTIKIGVIAPLTGEAASLSDVTVKPIEIWKQQLASAGGVNGKNVEFIIEDGKCSAKDASNAAQKLVQINKVQYIIGLCSNEMMSIAPIAEKNKVLALSPTATSPMLTDAGDFVFRTAPSDLTQGQVFADYANKNFRKVGVIYENTDYGLGLARAFTTALDIPVVEESFLSTEADFKTRITKLKSAGVDGLVLIPNSGPKFEILMRQLKQLNWDKPLFLNEVASGSAFLVTDYADYLTDITAYGVNFATPTTDKVTDYLIAYEASTGSKPEYQSFTIAMAGLIEMLEHIWINTEPTDTEAVRDALYGLDGFKSILGTTSFNENGDIDITYSLYKFDGAEFVPVN